mgnify:CR=1 FL=1
MGRFFLEQPAAAKEAREAASQGWQLEEASEATMRRELEEVAPRVSLEELLGDEAMLAEALAQWREMMDRDDPEVLCRCTGYAKINDAVLLAAARMRGEEAEA